MNVIFLFIIVSCARYDSANLKKGLLEKIEKIEKDDSKLVIPETIKSYLKKK